MRSVVALYDRFEDAQQAVRTLRDSNFDQADINMIARDANGEYSRSLGNMDLSKTGEEVGSGAASGAGVGAVLGGLGGLLVGLGALAIPGIGPVIAAGPILTTLGGAGLGAVAGGLIGALVDLGIPNEHAEYYAEGVRRGGTLVIVRTADDRAEEARQILNRFHPVDLESRARAWKEGHWTGFNESGEPLTSEQMEFNRSGAQMPVTGSDTETRTSHMEHMGHEEPMGHETGSMGREDMKSTGRDMSQETNKDFKPAGAGDISRGQEVYDNLEPGDEIRGVSKGEEVYGEGAPGGGIPEPSRGEQVYGEGQPVEPREPSRGEQVYGERDWVSSTGSGPISSGAPPAGGSTHIPVTGGGQGRRDDNLSDEFGMDEHIADDIYGKERAPEEGLEIPVTGGTMDVEEIEEIDVFPVDTQDWMTYDQAFRTDYLSRFGNQGYGYEHYQPAYRYGYYLARSPQYQGEDWDILEPQARKDWQRSGVSGAWEEVKDAVRFAWERVKRI